MRGAARRFFDFVERRLGRLAEHRLRLALSAAGFVGSLRNRLSRRWPSPREIGALFPLLGPREAAKAAWKIGGIEARNRIFAAHLEEDDARLAQELMSRPFPDLARLRPPFIVGSFHVGALQALRAALTWLPAPVLVLRLGYRTPTLPTHTVLAVGETAQQRAALFARALAHLRSGGVVVLALDYVTGPAFRVPFLGRSLELARSPFAMARLAGAPLWPVAVRWRGGAVDIEVGDELTADRSSCPEACEEEMAMAAARWLEKYLRSDPGETGLGLLHRLVLPREA